MPKYLLSITVNVKGKRKRIYAGYSTIVSDWITPFYASLEKLREEHPEFKNMKPVSWKHVFGRNAKARIVNGNLELVAYRPVYVLKPKK